MRETWRCCIVGGPLTLRVPRDWEIGVHGRLKMRNCLRVGFVMVFYLRGFAHTRSLRKGFIGQSGKQEPGDILSSIPFPYHGSNSVHQALCLERGGTFQIQQCHDPPQPAVRMHNSQPTGRGAQTPQASVSMTQPSLPTISVSSSTSKSLIPNHTRSRVHSEKPTVPSNLGQLQSSP
jgi:hypothetical protein